MRGIEADAGADPTPTTDSKGRVPGPGPTPLGAWAPVAVWVGVIFALSSIPSLSTGLGMWDLVLRKIAHVVEFAVLGALLLRAVRREPTAVLLGAAYAATDEVHQAFVGGREGSPVDWLIDIVGVVAGVFLASRTRK